MKSVICLWFFMLCYGVTPGSEQEALIPYDNGNIFNGQEYKVLLTNQEPLQIFNRGYR